MNKRIILSITCLILTTVLCVLTIANNGETTNPEAEQHFEKANELRKTNDLSAAIAEFEQVIELSPKSEYAQNAKYWIGQLYFEERQFDTALTTFHELIDEFPGSSLVSKTETMIEQVQQAKKNLLFSEAVQNGDIDQVKLLISQGVDVNFSETNFLGMTPLHTAIWYNHKDIAELLIDNGADASRALQILIISYDRMVQRSTGIVSGFYKDVASLLINKGAEVNLIMVNGNTLLQSAVSIGDIEIIKLLIDNGAKLDAKNSNGLTASHVAASLGRKDIIELFINKGADVSGFNIAAFKGDLDRVKEFIEKGIQVDQKDEAGWTALSWAIYGDQKNVAEFLIDNGISVDVKDEQGNTPLHITSHRDVAEFLISKGADLNAKNDRGNIPLQAAISNGNKEIVELLIDDYGADVNTHNPNGWTLLHDAAAIGHTDIVELLINKGAEIDCKNHFGMTPLASAAMSGRTDIVKLLINKGADVNIKANFGLTALNIAMNRGYTEIVELLREHGAEE